MCIKTPLIRDLICLSEIKFFHIYPFASLTRSISFLFAGYLLLLTISVLEDHLFPRVKA